MRSKTRAVKRTSKLFSKSILIDTKQSYMGQKKTQTFRVRMATATSNNLTQITLHFFLISPEVVKTNEKKQFHALIWMFAKLERNYKDGATMHKSVTLVRLIYVARTKSKL